MRLRLTAKFAQHAPIGWHADGGGLYLQCSAGAVGVINRSWVYRYGTKSRYLGLGSALDVTLAEAREKALAARKQRLEGIDPIDNRRAQRATARLRALEFTILCSTRTSETILAEFSEIDFQNRIWTIPSNRMKAGKEHRIPLCERAINILHQLSRNGPRIFPISNMTMLELLRGMRPGLTVHGFRSTFMDWCHECTNFPKTVIDMSLAHKVSDAVEASYRRGDLFVKRAKLMDEWSRYCGKLPISSETIIAFHRAP
jgi:integrase